MRVVGSLGSALGFSSRLLLQIWILLLRFHFWLLARDKNAGELLVVHLAIAVDVVILEYFVKFLDKKSEKSGGTLTGLSMTTPVFSMAR